MARSNSMSHPRQTEECHGQLIPDQLHQHQHQHRHYSPSSHRLSIFTFFASVSLPSFSSPFSSLLFLLVVFCLSIYLLICLSVLTVQFLFCISTLGVGLIGVLSNYLLLFNNLLHIQHSFFLLLELHFVLHSIICYWLYKVMITPILKPVIFESNIRYSHSPG